MFGELGGDESGKEADGGMARTLGRSPWALNVWRKVVSCLKDSEWLRSSFQKKDERTVGFVVGEGLKRVDTGDW